MAHTPDVQSASTDYARLRECKLAFYCVGKKQKFSCGKQENWRKRKVWLDMQNISDSTLQNKSDLISIYRDRFEQHKVGSRHSFDENELFENYQAAVKEDSLKEPFDTFKNRYINKKMSNDWRHSFNVPGLISEYEVAEFDDKTVEQIFEQFKAVWLTNVEIIPLANGAKSDKKTATTPAEKPKFEGYTIVPNSVLDAMADMSESELRTTLTVLRKTFGYADKTGERKNQDAISKTQFEKFTGLSRPHVIKGVRAAIARGSIKEIVQGPSKTNIYAPTYQIPRKNRK